MISASKGSKREAPFAIEAIRRRMFVLRQLLEHFNPVRRCRRDPGVELAGAHRNPAFDASPYLRSRNVPTRERRADCNHPAANVYADCGWNDGPICWKH